MSTCIRLDLGNTRILTDLVNGNPQTTLVTGVKRSLGPTPSHVLGIRKRMECK